MISLAPAGPPPVINLYQLSKHQTAPQIISPMFMSKSITTFSGCGGDVVRWVGGSGNNY